MAIKGYFFNAIESGGQYDRAYNAEDVTRYLDLIVGSGVFPTPSTHLQVIAGSGMQVIVKEGQGWINGHKIINTAALSLSIDGSDVLLDRIDRVIFYADSTTREMGIEVLKGDKAISPVAPALTRNETRYEMSLATVYVAKNATAITDAVITDTRADSDVCGWVAGLIQQIDTSALFEQYNAAYNEMLEKMREWMQNQESQFDAWYYNLTQNLTVGAYIKNYRKVVQGGTGVSNIVALDMDDYEYDSNDVIIANYNGLILTKGVDYTLDTAINPVEMHLTGDMTTGNLLEIVVLKSNMAQTTGGMLTSARGDKFIHVDDALPETAHGFTIDTLGTTNLVAVANRNLFRGDLLETDTVDGITFTKNVNGSVTVDGTSEADDAKVEVEIDKNAFIVGNNYVLSTGKTEGDAVLKLVLTYTDETSETITAQNAPESILIEKEVASAVASIEVPTSGTVVDDEVVLPQIEVGTTPTDFVKNTYSSFNYDGSTKPVLTDTIDNIWTNDDGASGLQLIYVVLNSEVNGDLIQY